MSFPYANAMSISATLSDVVATTSPVLLLRSGEYPLWAVPRAVDVSGMDLAIADVLDGSTAGTQAIASAASTVVLKPYDGGTSASAASDNNELFAVGDFSNSITGGWTAHAAIRAVGTSTTDLDADDWVNLDVAANISGTGGFGEVIVQAFFVYGVPGGPA